MKHAVVILAVLLSLNLLRMFELHPRLSLSVAARENPISAASPQILEEPEDSALVGGGLPWVSQEGPGETGLLSEVSAESDPERRTELLSVRAQSVTDFPETLNLLLGLDSSAAAELRQLLIRRWTENAPETAAAWAVQLPDGISSREALSQVGITWANSDLHAAIEWVTSLPESASRLNTILDVAYEAARTEPMAAIEVGAVLPSSPERDKLLAHAVSQWTSVDPAAAVTWAESVSDSACRQQLVSAALVALAAQNGKTAANLAATVLRPGDEQDRVVVAVVQQWAESAPREAANWVTAFPDTPTRQVAVQNLVTLWTAQDPAGTVNWLQTLPESSLRKTGWSAYAQAIRQHDSEDTLFQQTIPNAPLTGPQRN